MSYIFIYGIFLVLGIFPAVLTFFIVKKIKNKNKTAILISFLVALIEFLTYIIFKLSIFDILIYHFLLALTAIPSLFVFFIVKSVIGKNNPAIIISLFAFISICSLIYFYIYTRNVLNNIIVLNYYDKDIYINKVYIENKTIFQGKYLLKPSDKNKLWFQNDALRREYNIASNKHNLGVILNIEFYDGNIDKKSSVQLIDEKKSGCIFYIYYKGNKEFSAICGSLYIDPAW